MKPIKCGKLVRDRIPEIIKSDGYTPVCTNLTAEAYTKALLAKLVEEVGEYTGSEDVSELVDIYEVVMCLAKNKGVDSTEFIRLAGVKRKERGSLIAGVFLSEIIAG